MKTFLQKSLAILTLLVCALTINAQTKVYFFEIDDNIAKPALRKTERQSLRLPK